MRISDWSSDVCSSDLGETYHFCSARCRERFEAEPARYLAPAEPGKPAAQRHYCGDHPAHKDVAGGGHHESAVKDLVCGMRERKSVVEGKSVSVRVDLGGGRVMKKKNTNKNRTE